MDEFKQLIDLENGAYELANPYMTEASRYAATEFNRLYYQGIRLPEGKSNVVYLLSSDFSSTLRFMNHPRSLIIPTSYRKVFYPVWSKGMFMNRMYTHSVVKKTLDQQIREETKFNPYPSKTLLATNENILFVASGLYETVRPVLERATVKRCYTEFWTEFAALLQRMTPAPKTTSDKDGCRFLLIDAGSFPFQKDLKINKLNPLYLLYLAFFRNHSLQELNVDMNIVILSGNLFIKINPMQINRANWATFRTALNKIMNVDLGQYTDNLPDEEKKEVDTSVADTVVQRVVNQKTEPFVANVSKETKALVKATVEDQFRQKVTQIAHADAEIKQAQKDIASASGTKVPVSTHSGVSKSFIHQDPVQNPLDPRHAALFKSISGYQGLADETDEEWAGRPADLDEVSEDLGDDIQEILTTDQEVAAQVMDIVQDKVLPMKDKKKAPINSARDAKLREEQKKVAVRTEPIEKILEREATNVPIQEDDHSAVLHTSNPNMKRSKFINFEKTYLDKLYNRDIVNCFMSLSEKEHPFYITKVDVKDTSTSMNLQETWSVGLKDEAGRNSTVVVDIPKFQNDRFMWLEGVRYVILKQNFYNPLVKDTPDTVICRTNYNTVTIDRVGTKSLLATERIFSLIKKTGDAKMFMTGDSSQSNMGNLNYINSLEYDELSRRLFRFTSGNCELFFSREYIKNNLQDQIPPSIQGNEFYIGHVGAEAILINEDTGLDRRGRTITQIIEENLPSEYAKIYESIKAPKQTMYVQCKIANQRVPIICPLIVWNGITATLNAMGIDWTFKEGRVKQDGNHRYIRFRDGYLIYAPGSFQELVLNGMMLFKPEEFAFNDFETEVGYLDFIFAKWGSYRGITQLNTFKEFLVDPITKDVCRDMNLPQEPTGLLLHAVKLLCDNSYVSKASDVSYRVRSIEIIPAILNECLAKQYQTYVSTGGNIKMTLSRRVVINNLLKVPTVKGYSTLNPVVEMSEMSSISTRGYKGSNSIHAYRDERKRSYDPTSIGKLAMSTSPDANVGVTRSLTVEPTISNARGYRQPVDDIHQLKDVNILSPVEMLTPGTALGDDPIRTAINDFSPAKTLG